MNAAESNSAYWWRPLKKESVANTRNIILFAAFKEIHQKGFQAASLNNILSATDVTKGALYHYFKNKTELGYAVIEEEIWCRIFHRFIEPVENSNNTVSILISQIEHFGQEFTLRDIELGCPLGNLNHEMSPVDEGFRVRLNRIYQRWYDSLTRAIIQSQNSGIIRKNIEPKNTAVMIVATLEGCISAGKVSQDMNRLQDCGKGLIQYLTSLRTDKNP